MNRNILRLLLSAAFVMCCSFSALADLGTPPNNQIWYTSTDGQVVNPYDSDVFGATIVSNTYQDGKGIIKFNGQVTSIGVHAFFYCESLSSISLPSGPTSIGDYAFLSCMSLSSVSLPSGLTSIGEGAFQSCESLPSVSLPSGLTSIGKSAFQYCNNLSSINIPNGVTSIGESAFESCQSLSSINIPNGVTSIGESAFENCRSLSSVSLPSGLTSIGEGAFQSCWSLPSVSLPSSLTSIGVHAFFDCKSLSSIAVFAPNPPTLGTDAFIGISPFVVTVHVPNDGIDSYWSAWRSYFHEFAEFVTLTTDDYRQQALYEINRAMQGLELTTEEQAAINGYIQTINDAEDITTVVNAKEAVLAFIRLKPDKTEAIAAIEAAMQGVELTTEEQTAINDYIQTITYAVDVTDIENAKEAALACIGLRLAKTEAIAAIEAAMQGETGAYITGLVQQYVSIINAATDVTAINNARDTALPAVTAYKAGKAEGLGEMGTECDDCPAVEVKKGNETIILYGPESVTFKKKE